MRRILCRVWTVAAAALLVWPVLAWAQSTQPALPRDWATTVQQLATALSGSELPAVQAMLEPTPGIRAFSSERLQTPARLLGVTNGSTVVAAHAYPGIPQTLASDLAEDFRVAGEAIPELTRQQMIPADEAAARRANATAARWIQSVLRQNEAETAPTAVIVLWPAERKARLERLVRRPIFILALGEQQGDRLVFREIVFGDPLEPAH